MNAFADILLSLLLGWLKELTQFLWSFFSGGGSKGFLPWLGDHWKGLAVLLCAVGLILDLLVWLQNRRAAAAGRRAPAGENAGETWGFDQGFEDSLDMKGLAFQEEAEKEKKELFPQAERRPLRDNSEKVFYPVQTAYEAREEAEFPEEGPVEFPEGLSGEAVPAAEKDTRRRRSDKHDSRERRRLFHRVNSLISADGQDGVLDGLPPVIDKKEAFHKPVYPK